MNLTLDILDILVDKRRIKLTELYKTLSKRWSTYSVMKQLNEMRRREYIEIFEEEGEKYVKIGEKLDRTMSIVW